MKNVKKPSYSFRRMGSSIGRALVQLLLSLMEIRSMLLMWAIVGLLWAQSMGKLLVSCQLTIKLAHSISKKGLWMWEGKFIKPNSDMQIQIVKYFTRANIINLLSDPIELCQEGCRQQEPLEISKLNYPNLKETPKQ